MPQTAFGGRAAIAGTTTDPEDLGI
jgi:hypothetical protein